MFSILPRLLLPALLALHSGLLLWALVGLIEWFAPSVPWPALSNPLFPRWLLLLHWMAISIAAAIFLCGFLTRWPHTPNAMIPAYGFMAVVCTVETVWYLEHPLHYLAMVFEFAAYVVIPLAMHHEPRLAARFAPRPFNCEAREAVCNSPR